MQLRMFRVGKTILQVRTLARRLYQGSHCHATEICKYDADMHPRCNSRAGKAHRVPNGTRQGSVAAGSDSAGTLLHNATNSDFAPKPYRPTRPTTVPSKPPMLQLQLRFHKDCFAKHLQIFHNCNANKGNCNEQVHSKHASQCDAVPRDAIPVKMQSKAMPSKQCHPSNATQSNAIQSIATPK